MAKWQDHMSPTHIASPPHSHVHPSGNTTPDDSLGTSGIPGWLVAKFREEAEKRREVAASAERAAFKFSSGQVQREADKFLQTNGARLEWKRGGKQLKIPDVVCVTRKGIF